MLWRLVTWITLCWMRMERTRTPERYVSEQWLTEHAQTDDTRGLDLPVWKWPVPPRNR